MTGFVAGALDPNQWAWSPRDLSRVLGDRLGEAIDVHAAGRAAWVASRWDGPIRLTEEAIDLWAADWRAEVAARKAR